MLNSPTSKNLVHILPQKKPPVSFILNPCNSYLAATFIDLSSEYNSSLRQEQMKQ